MNRTKAEKRFLDYRKAKRKKNIAKYIYGLECYDNLNQYSKNKIQYSYPIRVQLVETNQKKFKSKNKNIGFNRWNRHQSKYSKNLSHSDNIKIIRLEEQLYG